MAVPARRQRQLHSSSPPRLLARNESYTPAECYAACNVLLNSPPEFLFNVFFENGTYHCTCCLICVQQRPVEGAAVYETCTVANEVVIGGKLYRKHAQPGKKLLYFVSLARAVSKGRQSRGAIEGLGLRITLPAGVTHLETLAAPPLRPSNSKGMQKYTQPDSLEAGDGSGEVLTWNNISLSSQQKVQHLAVRVQVLGVDSLLRLRDRSGAKGTGRKRIHTIPLAFGASVFQMGGVNGTQPICERSAPSSVAEVTVKRKTEEVLWWKRDAAHSASVGHQVGSF